MDVNRCFVDTWFWIAVINEKDQHHRKARDILARTRAARLITTEMVIAELLNMYAGKGSFWRSKVVQFVDGLRKDKRTTIVEQTPEQFFKAFGKYKLHVDKEWGLTDCASFVLMEEQSLQYALTDDRHFEQAGFIKAI